MKGAPVFFSMRAYSSGLIEFSGLNLEGTGFERYKIELSQSGTMEGVVDSEGYPAARPFAYTATSATLSDGYLGVRGTASVNGSP